MSLKITRRGLEVFDATVEVSLPTTGDRFIEGRFKAHFKYVPMARYAELIDTFQQGVTDGDRLAEMLADKVRAVDEVLVRVEGIADENGELSAEEQREFVLGNLVAMNATLIAFLQRYQGAPAKNSKPSPKP